MASNDKTYVPFSRGSDDDYSLVCLPCHRDDTTVPAYGFCIDCQEHLCQACYKHHRKATPCRHHKLQDKCVMPSSQQLTDTSVQALQHKNDDITPTCQGEICVKTSQDGRGCVIMGMTMLPPDRLVLTDWHDKNIKLVDVNNKSITSQLSFGTEDIDGPYDITSITSTQVAVTVPGRKHIQFLSVSDEVCKTRKIQTNGICTGICCYQEKLFVTYIAPGKLEILGMKGRVITRVTSDLTSKDVFIYPFHVQANNNSIYVSDCELKEIIMLNWQGVVTGRNADCGGPAGLAQLGDGSLIVCDGDGSRMCQVSGDCTNTRTMLQYVRPPCAVCVDDGGHKLYISRLTGIDDQCANNILVYNI